MSELGVTAGYRTDPGANLIDQLLAEQRSLTAVERFSQWHAGEHATDRYRHLMPAGLPSRGEQYAFEVDLDCCTGCKACVSACHSLNGLDEDEAWRDVGLLLGGRGTDAYQQTVTTACHHCADPACLNGCPVGAYEKQADTGVVRHLDDQCIGCGYCVLKCPYDVPKYNPKLGIVRKCDMCVGRLRAGEAPACVQACPTSAIRIRVVRLEDLNFTPGTTMLPGAHDSSYTRPASLVCGFCATGCSLTAHLRHGEAINLSPNPVYPVNLAMACPKGWEALTPLDAPDRGTTPLLNGEPVDWSVAAGAFVDRMKAIIAEHGPEAVAVLSTGQIVTEEMAFLGAFAKFGMRLRHIDSNTRQCMATAAVAYKQSFGFDAPPYTYADFELSDVLVFVGANPCIAHPIMWQRVMMNSRSPTIVVVDPRRTETAMAATHHFAIQPKSDLVLFYGLAHLLIQRGAVDEAFIIASTTGIQGYGMIEREGGVQWPLAQAHRGELKTERRLFEDGRFFHPDGRAKFLFDAPRALPEPVDEAYPMILLTGRGSSAQWHTNTRTAKSEVLRMLYPQQGYVEIHPDDARALKIADRARVSIASRRACVHATVKITACVQRGQIFMPMHDEEVNKLTLAAFDPHSRQPSYKACAIRIGSGAEPT